MRLSLIAAVAKNGVIGADNDIPWHLPADLKWFKTMTMGKPIIMGRKTHESIGKPLPGRENIVLTRNPNYHAPGCTVVHSIDDALDAAGDADEAIVIGGAHLYAQTFPQADRLYLTCVEAEVPGDTHFPPFDKDQWRVTFAESHEPDQKNPYPYRFMILER